jgi:hypothetical protein
VCSVSLVTAERPAPDTASYVATNALDAESIVERLERHDHLNRRAIRIGDNAAGPAIGEAVGIELRHDERKLALVTKVRRIVDDDGTGRCSARRVLARYACPATATATS